jgi:hypothetical protein
VYLLTQITNSIIFLSSLQIFGLVIHPAYAVKENEVCSEIAGNSTNLVKVWGKKSEHAVSKTPGQKTKYEV